MRRAFGSADLDPTLPVTQVAEAERVSLLYFIRKMLSGARAFGEQGTPMRSLLPTPPSPAKLKALAPRSDASVRDSVRILSEIVAQLSERIELLEARELLQRAR
jgi:hypothetical protein